MSYRQSFGPPHGDGLDVLGSQHGAHAAAARLAAEIVGHAGIAYPLFSARTDGHDLEILTQIGLEVLLGGQGALPPVSSGRTDFHPIVVDEPGSWAQPSAR
jgi:hypothetical protein